MVNYRYLGYGTTNINGVADFDHDTNGNTLLHSYTGTGAGKIDMVASLDSNITSSSLVSGICSVYDCLVYDNARDGFQSLNWGIDGTITTSASNNGTTLTASVTSTYYSTIPIDENIDFECTLEVNDIIQGVRIGFAKTSDFTKACRYNFLSTSGKYIKITRINGVYTILNSTDGETWNSRNPEKDNITEGDVCFIFYLYTSNNVTRSITFNDLKIYKI